MGNRVEIDTLLIVRASELKNLIEEIEEILYTNRIALIVKPDFEFDKFFAIENETEDVEIEISDEHFLILAKKAHEEDKTLNQIINQILKEEVERCKLT